VIREVAFPEGDPPLPLTARGAIELDIAMIFEPASRTDVNSRFAPEL
jgi:hypothetical protein